MYVCSGLTWWFPLGLKVLNGYRQLYTTLNKLLVVRLSSSAPASHSKGRSYSVHMTKYKVHWELLTRNEGICDISLRAAPEDVPRRGNVGRIYYPVAARVNQRAEILAVVVKIFFDVDIVEKKQIECGLALSALLSTTIFVITVVKICCGLTRRKTFWPLWWRISLSIRVQTTLNHIRFVNYTCLCVFTESTEEMVTYLIVC